MINKGLVKKFAKKVSEAYPISYSEVVGIVTEIIYDTASAGLAMGQLKRTLELIIKEGVIGMVDLGDEVKDTVSGFRGIAVAKVTYLQGCDRIAIQAPVKKNGKPEDWVYVDEPQIKVLKKGVAKQGSKVTGGFKPDNVQRRF